MGDDYTILKRPESIHKHQSLPTTVKTPSPDSNAPPHDQQAPVAARPACPNEKASSSPNQLHQAQKRFRTGSSVRFGRWYICSRCRERKKDDGFHENQIKRNRQQGNAFRNPVQRASST
ncbi:hypothetical protein T439DRAFT_248200 [Meredithblackwellia eburnea MCA 4105]